MNPLTSRAQAEAIAEAVHLIRPEWDTPGILAAVAKVAHRHPCDVLMAATRAAANPELKNPGAIGNQQSEVWRERVTVPTSPRNPTPATACHDCGRERDTCGCPDPTERSPLVAAHIKTLRAEVARVRTEEDSHG